MIGLLTIVWALTFGGLFTFLRWCIGFKVERALFEAGVVSAFTLTIVGALLMVLGL